MFKRKVYKEDSECFKVTIADETIAVVDVPVDHSFLYEHVYVELVNRTSDKPEWWFSLDHRILFTMPEVWGPKDIQKRIDEGGYFYKGLVDTRKVARTFVKAKMAIKRQNAAILNPDRYFFIQRDDLTWEGYENHDGNLTPFDIGIVLMNPRPQDVADYILNTFCKKAVMVQLSYASGREAREFLHV